MGLLVSEESRDAKLNPASMKGFKEGERHTAGEMTFRRGVSEVDSLEVIVGEGRRRETFFPPASNFFSQGRCFAGHEQEAAAVAAQLERSSSSRLRSSSGGSSQPAGRERELSDACLPKLTGSDLRLASGWASVGVGWLLRCSSSLCVSGGGW